MSTRNLFTGKSTSGFTLIELVIVLVIIGMLAAVVVSKMDKVPAKAEDVINTSNINELNKFVQMHAVKSDPIGLVPDELDSLTDSTNNLITNVPWASGYIQTNSSIPAEDRAALNAIGINNVHRDGEADVINLSTATSLAVLNTTASGLGNTPISVMGQRIDFTNDPQYNNGERFYVFGIGPHNTAATDVRLANISSCPLIKDPTIYNHYLLLVMVDNNNIAEYLGVIDPYFQECLK